MPTNLYYTGDNIHNIGEDNTYQLLTNSALETMHRLHVGGREITAKDDTSVFRSWDSDYSFLASEPGVVPVNLSIQLHYSMIPNYTAPDEVYMTARTMGTNKTEHMMYNLTWALEVDAGFTYLVRLHFCEFQPEIQAVSDREFKIYIANQTGEEQADVVVWSGGNGIPVNTVELDMQMLFKISDSDNNLGGPNPNPTNLAGVVIIALFGVLVFRRRMRRVKDTASGDTASWRSPLV
ncbi:Malectin-like domain [Dillenia turbinata]|uniref:Malectin-like domain n=1 Tax=Dillenia turbinata TaxID=194707 RepID=A0AAN8UKB5_9MAGN